MADPIYSVKKGDLFTGPVVTVTSADPTFDFTGCDVQSQLRVSASAGEVLYEFVITPNYAILGQATFSLSIPGVDTATLPPQTLVSDVVMSRDTPSFGPYTLFSFGLTVMNRVTHAPPP